MNQGFSAHDLWTRVCQEEMTELDETCMTMQRTKKFAELIVRECVNQVDEFSRLTKAYQAQGIDTEIDVAKEVLKNFGVEK